MFHKAASLHSVRGTFRLMAPFTTMWCSNGITPGKPLNGRETMTGGSVNCAVTSYEHEMVNPVQRNVFGVRILGLPSPSYWPYIYVVVRPEIYLYGKVECAKSIFILSKSLKFETFSLGACVKFIIHLKCNFVSTPYVFIINEIRNILSNAIFSMLDLDFAVFQKKKHDTN